MKKKNIALFMAILDNEFSASILDGAAKAAKDADCNLVVFPMDILCANYNDYHVNTYRYQYNILDSFLKNNSFDGMVIEYGTVVSALNESQKEEFLKKIGDTPVILLAEKHEKYSSFCVDNKAGLAELVEHVILHHNCKKIAFLSGPEENFDANERLGVYRATMEKHGLKHEGLVRYGNFSPYIGEQLDDLLKSHPDTEAIICANDSMALGACAYFEDHEKEVGKDIIVTGFDDVLPSFLNKPSITTVKASPNELAYEAVISLVDGNVKKFHTIPTRLVVRESCGCCLSEHNDSKKAELGITSDWRLNAKRILDENLIRTQYEHELSNVTREMVFSSHQEEGRYASIMKTFQRLQIHSSFLYLYDDYIENKIDDKWKMPEKLNLVAHFRGDEYSTCLRGEDVIETKSLFRDDRIQDENRHDYVMIPLFFGQNQIGMLLSETDSVNFKFVFLLAGQLSNSLAIVEMNNRQERMKKELEATSMYKSQFLANMSHEIRTPINAIIGFNEMILRESSSDVISEYSTDVKNASENLLALVNDILDFSKIEAGKMDIICDEYMLKSLVINVVEMVRDRAEKKNLKINIKFDERIPRILYGDKARLSQIVLNLITNAVKYTNEGGITLSVDLVQITDNKTATITVSIQDTGIGIKEEDIADLFVKFKRIEENRNRNIEGTGLGINIVASLLNLMGSEIKVESTYNVGSRFYFTLDQGIIDANPSGKIEGGAASGEKKVFRAGYKAPDAKILVVDDNALNCKVIKKLLGETNMAIDTAESGTKCLEMVKLTEYDVILLDHMMPGMDGIETLQEIKAQGLISPDKTKVIALTANAIMGAKETYIEAGFDNYLSKPVKPEDLNKMILQYLDEGKVVQ